jgi:hypothetical protein
MNEKDVMPEEVEELKKLISILMYFYNQTDQLQHFSLSLHDNINKFTVTENPFKHIFASGILSIMKNAALTINDTSSMKAGMLDAAEKLNSEYFKLTGKDFLSELFAKQVKKPQQESLSGGTVQDIVKHLIKQPTNEEQEDGLPVTIHKVKLMKPDENPNLFNAVLEWDRKFKAMEGIEDDKEEESCEDTEDIETPKNQN